MELKNMNHANKFLLLTAMLLIMATAAFCQTAVDYLKSAKQKELNGDLDGALADDNQVLSVNGNKDESSTLDANGSITDLIIFNQDGRAIDSRNLLRLAKGDFDDALSSFRKLTAGSPSSMTIDNCLIWVVENKKGLKSEADQELSTTLTAQASGSNTSDAVALNVAKFLLGKISEDDLTAAVISQYQNATEGYISDTNCWIYYFVGEKHFLNGDTAPATNNFRKILSRKMTMSDERTTIEIGILAQTELKAMGQLN